MYHLKDPETGKFGANPDVKDAFAKAGFKWKALTNDPSTGKRAQIMQAAKPATAPQFENTRRLNLGSEPLIIKIGTVLSQSN
jgi:hypothetical protein